MAMIMSIENHLVRLDVGRQSNSVQTYGVNCRSRRLSLPLLPADIAQYITMYIHVASISLTSSNCSTSDL